MVCLRGGFGERSPLVFRVGRMGVGASSIGANFKFDVAIRADTQDIVGQRHRNYDGINE